MTMELSNEVPAVAPTVTQSKFYSPAFNAAIFDGPLRIYFAQYQEAEALKIYFFLQEQLNENGQNLRARLKNLGGNVFVMLYPSPDIFSRSFEAAVDLKLTSDRLGDDLVIGINGVLSEGEYDGIVDEISRLAVAS